MGRWGSWGTGCGCCNTTCGVINVAVIDQCASTQIAGATVNVRDAATPPNTIGTCTTSRGISSIVRNSGGSGYTNGTGYPLGFSGGSPDATGTFDVASGAVTNLVLTSPGSYPSGTPTITFPGAGAGTGASASASLATRCSVAIPAAGTYTVSGTAPGYTSASSTRSFTCTTTSLSLTVSNWTPTYTISGSLVGCNGAGLAGETVTLSGPNGYTASTTTAADGHGSYSFGGLPGAGTYTANCTPNRFQPVSGSATLTVPATCNAAAGIIDLAPTVATGYRCSNWSCNGYPVSLRMMLSDSAYGTNTLITYDPTLGQWSGTQAVSYPGCSGSGFSCTARSVTITHALLDGGTFDPSCHFDNANCPDDAGTNIFGWPNWAISPFTCPTSSPASLFTYSAAMTGAFALYCSGTTLSVTEVLP